MKQALLLTLLTLVMPTSSAFAEQVVSVDATNATYRFTMNTVDGEIPLSHHIQELQVTIDTVVGDGELQPFPNAHRNLALQIGHEEKSQTFPLEQVTPGKYKVVLYPTSGGFYDYVIGGEIDGKQIRAEFKCDSALRGEDTAADGPPAFTGDFPCPKSIAGIAFPEAIGGASGLERQINALKQAVSLEPSLGQAGEEVSDGFSKGDLYLLIVLLIALLGTGIGTTAMYMWWREVHI